jgi:hypothetical protein
MDVANEAATAAPEPPPPESIPTPTPIVSPPVPVPVPAGATEAEDAVLAFQPTRVRTWIVRPFWAGLLGAGAGMWTGSVIQLCVRARLLERLEPATAFFLPVGVALGVALWRGFRAPVQSYASLLGRVVGTLFFGGICALVAVLIAAAILDGLRVGHEAAFTVMALLGALLAGLALARIHGIGADRSRRIKIAAGAVAVLVVTAWPASPQARCRLGSGEGCREAAATLASEGDYRASGALGARGCSDGEPVACRLAGRAYQIEGPSRDLPRAQDFFREGCALGDPASCDAVHELELEQRCDRYGTFACAELARAHATGDGAIRDRALAQRYYRKACLLGSDDACREANGR